jgi:hypothetical protein
VQPRKLAIFAIAILTVGLTAAIGNNLSLADQATTQPVEMRIRRNVSDIEISGQVSSPAHETILLEILGRQESLTTTSIELSHAELPPPGWALLTELALQATLLTRFAETTIDETGGRIRGVTSDPVAWKGAMKRLETALLPGMQMEYRVVEISPASTFTSLCREQFAAAIDKGPLQFAAGRAEIDSQARAMLDSLNETAADCAKWHISVRAYGDRSSAADDKLEAARAQSIIDYLTGHGLAPPRIAVAADMASASGRYGQAMFSVSIGNSDSTQGGDAPDARDGSTATTAAPLAN